MMRRRLAAFSPGALARVALSALATAFFALPILFLVSVSFKTKDDVLTGDFLPHGPTLANWAGAFAAAPCFPAC